VITDTINIMDFNRAQVGKRLIDLDTFWEPGTFTARGTSIDKIKDIPAGNSTWKAEDMSLDGVFAQIFTLPTPEHKLVYYHSVITEMCRQSPATIAPCLGRAMRWLFKRADTLDLELTYRFVDWFAQHLSNFDFRWKWDEW
jgi:nuclear cap-binding protein subunit 1